MDLSKLIAAQRKALEATPAQELVVVLGGKKVPVQLSKLMPDDWDILVQSNPPRSTVANDKTLGYDQSAVSKKYPGVVVAGEPVDAEQWAEVFSVLDSVHRNNISIVIWSLNVNGPLQELVELGKARTGQK